MIISVTGTPGTGKTSVIEYIRNNPACRDKFLIIDLNRLIIDEQIYEDRDESRDTLNVDIEKIRLRITAIIREIAGFDSRTDVEISRDTIIEGHLSHFLNPDLIIVLRARPDILMKRLENRKYSYAKVLENADAEALDAILIESVEESDNVFEIDTTEKDIANVADSVLYIIEAFRREDKDALKDFKPGKIDWCNFVKIR